MRPFRRTGPLAVFGAAVAGLLAIAACAPPAAAPGAGDGGVAVAAQTPQTVIVHGAAPVDVVLTDSGPSGPMSIVTFESSAPAGEVTFRVKNLGTMEHEMIVLKTDTPFDQLPVADAGDPPAPVTTGANKVDEANNVGETGDPNLKPGETRTFTVKLAAGKYVLVCNLAGHYQMGMRAPFTVTAAAGQAAALPTTIHVQLADHGPNGPMSVTPDSYVGAAGTVTFAVKNAGTMEHEMIVLKTDTPFDQLPVADAGDPPAPVATGANKVDEANNVGETGDPNLKPGETRTFTVKLAPGKYVLVCNLAGHYQMGMRAPFQVVAPDQPLPSTVNVQLADHGPNGPMSVTPDSYVGAAGTVTFAVKNAGTMEHEMIVLKTDTPFDQLPVADAGDPPAPVATGANKVDEANNVGETGDPNLKPGETRTFTVKLAPGKYVLVCNLAGHYQMGMRAPFEVQ